jgi:putative flavoprotein involved in K+ transport
VLLERGEPGNSWRHERWDSLRLLTPNWLCRLPGYRYNGADPDGFMTSPEVAAFISGYAAAIGAPVRANTSVTGVSRTEGGYRVSTDRGELQCRSVVLASGAANLPRVPELRPAVPAAVQCLTAFEYRNPQHLPPGGVLVVGGSATGLQLADEIRRSDRPVWLCVGEHVRLPRNYRGRDVLWWMEKSGIWNQRYDEIEDLERARGLPSPQLIGSTDHATLDLNALRAAGVQIVGRLAAIRDGRALFSGGLANQLALADLKLERLLDTFDAWAAEQTACEELAPPERFEPTGVPTSPPLSLDLTRGAVRTIIWATGFRPDYRWLYLPVLNAKGELRHDGGVVTDAPGVYAMGLPVLRRRKSSFIHGAEDDARDLIAHLALYLADRDVSAARIHLGKPGAQS